MNPSVHRRWRQAHGRALGFAEAKRASFDFTGSLPFDIEARMDALSRVPDPAQQGDSAAAEELLPLVYEDLRSLAAVKMARENPGQTLQPTALVHEAWLRISRESRAEFKTKEQFYAVAAEVMRRILVDRARRRLAAKHGGQLERVDLDAVEMPAAENSTVLLRIHEALELLAAADPLKAEVVKLRFFVGLDHREVAALLGVSVKSVERHWAFAKAWLGRALKQAPLPNEYFEKKSN